MCHVTYLRARASRITQITKITTAAAALKISLPIDHSLSSPGFAAI
jgi:hypothetical protein